MPQPLSRADSHSPVAPGTVSFDGEFLWMTSASRTTRIAAWPGLEAWSRHPGGAWRRHSPRADFRALLALVEGPVASLPLSLAAWRALLATVPHAVRKAVAPFPSAHWDLARLLAVAPTAIELFDAPAIPFLLACSRRFLRAGGLAGPALAALVAGPRRAILGRLGFPASKSLLRILSRVTVDALDVSRLRAFRSAVLESPDVPALLRHVERVTAPALQVVTQRALRRAVRESFVQELAAEPDDEASRHVRLLADALEMARQILARAPNCPAALPRSGFRCTRELRTAHDALAVEFAALQVRGRPFPAPPIQGTAGIEPLRTPYELAREGRLQRHCVASYARRVRKGRCYVYRILQPERATLCLVFRRGAWGVEALQGKANRPVAAATLVAIYSWLRGAPRLPPGR